MALPKLLIICHTNLGNSLSGGDRIFINLIKFWKKYFDITLIGSQESAKLLDRFNINIPFFQTSSSNPITLTTANLIKHHLIRFLSAIKYTFYYRHIISTQDYIYTSSDFYGDFTFGVLSKFINPKIKWLCGYYLLAPTPLSKLSPYNLHHHFFRGLIYFIAQVPTRILANILATFVFITSIPDSKYFPGKSLVVQGGVFIPPATQLKKMKKLTDRKYDAFYLGRLHQQKGLLTLVNIWKLVVNKIPHAKLIIVGDGELKTEITHRINQLNLSQNIFLSGFLIGPKKYNIIKDSKIVVHPATHDSGGMAAAEAMAWGLPGVAFDLESLRSYYPQGMIKTKKFDELIFSQNIIKLLTNQQLYSKTSTEARKLIIRNWNWSKKLDQVYQTLVARQ